MPHDPRLAHLPKYSRIDKKTGKKIIGATEIIRIRKENMAKGLATINEKVEPEKPKEEKPKAEAPKEEKPKAPVKPKRVRSKKVE